jgi:predicted RNA-binding Zn-ribbon protein involved in translation (DUF1610 family)
MKTLIGPKTGSRYVVPALSAVTDACESGDSIGWCIRCGAEAYGIEPDAAKYACDDCGKAAVYGAENLMLMGLFHADGADSE